MARSSSHLSQAVLRTEGTAPRRGFFRLRDKQREAIAGYLFLLPWFMGIIIFTGGPVLTSLYLSFTKYNLLSPPQWIGWANYQLLIHDEHYLHSVRVTLTYVLFSVPLKLAFALLLAMALNRGLRGLAIYRAIFYVPSLLGGSVAIAILWRQIFGPDGLVIKALSLIGIHTYSWVSSPNTALWTLILLAVWQFGSPMIIFLAGLKQIPPEYYEAASTDGAGSWTQFWKITLPLLTPLIFFNLILQMIGAFQAFTPALIVSGGDGGPVDSTLFYTLYLFIQGFGDLHMGYATAMAWVLLVVIAIFTAVAFLTSRFWVFYQDERG